LSTVNSRTKDFENEEKYYLSPYLSGEKQNPPWKLKP
jgi:hypothetical protein